MINTLLAFIVFINVDGADLVCSVPPSGTIDIIPGESITITECSTLIYRDGFENG